MKTSSKSVYSPPGFADYRNPNGELIDGLWRSESEPTAFLPVQSSPAGNNPPRSAKIVRETFTDYFMNEGSVEWQWEKSIN